MVNPGAPRAGCDACRIAKKGCTLERPSCARCLRLGKTCTGYRDTSQLQLRDETRAIRFKYERRSGPAAVVVVESARSASEDAQVVQHIDDLENRDSSGWDNHQVDALFDPSYNLTPGPYAFSIDQIATPHILEALGLRQRWGFLSTFKFDATQAPCIDLAARACGVAAMSNVREGETCPRPLTRLRYIAAVAAVNKALCDPVQCLTDEVMIAILLLGHYETLTRDDGSATLKTFTAHIAGATELLKLRGRSQFKSTIGRQIFRQLRYQILLLALWTKQQPPDFLDEWSFHCRAAAAFADDEMYDSGDELADIICITINARAEMTRRGIGDHVVADMYKGIDHQLAAWASRTIAEHPLWRYQKHPTHVRSPHIWNGKFHVYTEGPASLVWNTYRGVRIMVLRLREKLLTSHAVNSSADDADDAENRQLRLLQRQMADEICAAIPTNLGHTPDGVYKCHSVLLGRSASIWPLFMAGVVVLDRIERENLPIPMRMNPAALHQTDFGNYSASIAQEAWIQGRLDLIKEPFGLHWAGAMATMLRTDRAKIELWFT